MKRLMGVCDPNRVSGLVKIASRGQFDLVHTPEEAYVCKLFVHGWLDLWERRFGLKDLSPRNYRMYYRNLTPEERAKIDHYEELYSWWSNEYQKRYWARVDESASGLDRRAGREAKKRTKANLDHAQRILDSRYNWRAHCMMLYNYWIG